MKKAKLSKTNIKLFFPYCGKEEGFCKSEKGCVNPHNSVIDCPYYSRLHPISGTRPQSLFAERE